MLTLTEIWIYPVKSLGGIRLKSARIRKKGLAFDRRWMLVNEQNEFITQRTHPALALFKTSLADNGFVISHKGEQILLPVGEALSSDALQTTIWDDVVTTFEVSPLHSQWFSEKLGERVKLVTFPEENPRLVDEVYRINEDHVSLADGYPLLIIGEASLSDLNNRLDKALPMNRFRPNLVFRGGAPYEEDNWNNFSIGRNQFAGVKPCARCVMTTVNQDSGEKGLEPLATLATYRRRDGQVYFGQNVIPLNEHEINEGDEIIVQKK